MPILSALGAASIIRPSSGIFGNNSYNFNGSSYFTYPASSNFAIGTSNFSIECFVYINNTPSYSGTILDFGYVSGSPFNPIMLQIDTSLKLRFTRAIGGGGFPYILVSSSSISLNTWTYVAASRVSGSLRLFIGSSTVASSGIFSGTMTTTSTPHVGKANLLANSFFDGKISNLRFNAGSGFTSATVPTSPLVPQAATKMLTCQSTTIKDDSVANSGGPWTLTNYGVTVASPGPF